MKTIIVCIFNVSLLYEKPRSPIDVLSPLTFQGCNLLNTVSTLYPEKNIDADKIRCGVMAYG